MKTFFKIILNVIAIVGPVIALLAINHNWKQIIYFLNERGVYGMSWLTWSFLMLGIYLGVAFVVAIYSRAKDIHNQTKSDGETYFGGLLWPLAIMAIPYYMVELPAQWYAKYMSYKAMKKKLKKLGNVA